MSPPQRAEIPAGAPPWVQWVAWLVERLGGPLVLCGVLLWWMSADRSAATVERSQMVQTLTTAAAELIEDRKKATENIKQLTESIDILSEGFSETIRLEQQSATENIKQTELLQRAEATMAPVPEERRRQHAELSTLLSSIRDRLPNKPGD